MIEVHSIILKDFTYHDVKSVFNEAKDIKDMVICNSSVHNNMREKYDYILSYYPLFHKIAVNDYHGELFSNDQAIALVVGKEKFIKMCVPSVEYYRIFES